MRRIFACLLLPVLPLAALAQSYSSAPLLVIDRKAAQDAATVTVGENTTGEHVDNPAAPAAPQSPASPAAPAAPATPATPTSPAAPANPISKLWPRDTVKIFMPSCVRFRVEFVKPCLCVITKLMAAIPHDEFMKKNDDGTIEQDERLKQIRTDCATAPQQKPE